MPLRPKPTWKRFGSAQGHPSPVLAAISAIELNTNHPQPHLRRQMERNQTQRSWSQSPQSCKCQCSQKGAVLQPVYDLHGLPSITTATLARMELPARIQNESTNKNKLNIQNAEAYPLPQMFRTTLSTRMNLQLNRNLLITQAWKTHCIRTAIRTDRIGPDSI